jgi:hypothetical protein
MQSLAYNFEQQRQLMEAQLQVQAMRAEQLRIAKATNPSVSLMSRVRTVVGGKLIATGERMRQNMEAASEAAAAHSKAAQRA